MAPTSQISVCAEQTSPGRASQWLSWVHPEIIHEGREGRNIPKTKKPDPQFSDSSVCQAQIGRSKQGCHFRNVREASCPCDAGLHIWEKGRFLFKWETMYKPALDQDRPGRPA